MTNNKRLIVNKYGKNYRGNWQVIKYDNSGRPYVTYQKSKILFDNFLRCGEELEKMGYSGCYSTSYFSAYLIELNKNCDMARVTYLIC